MARNPYDGTKDLMPVYEDKKFLPSLHLQYLGKADLPGSDAPATPPAPPNTAPNFDERGHQPKRASGPARPSAHRTAGSPEERASQKAGKRKR